MPVGPKRFLSLRLALFYATYFGVIGVWLPFWPIWLTAQGLDKAEIGLLIGIGAIARLFANPLVAQIADRRGERRALMVWLGWGTAAVFVLFLCGSNLWWLLAVSLVFGVLSAPLLALGESLTMLTSASHGLDYGRVRLWGSMSFIVASVGSGLLLDGRSPAVIPWLVLGILLGQAGLCHALPDTRAPERYAAARGPIRQLLASPTFVVFLIATALVQASHALYYGFGTLLWQTAGHGEGVIGLLWAEGVVAEIVLFAFGPWLSRQLRPATLILIGGAAAALRWTLTAETTDLAVLFAVQPLHALTFGATHFGAVRLVAEWVHPSASATAQSLYAGVANGAVMGIAMWTAGPLAEALGDRAYLVMAAMAVAGTAMAVLLWRGTRDPASRILSKQHLSD